MNVQSLHERLYELIEVLRPDFDEQARRLRGDNAEEDGLAAAREELAKLLETHPNLINSQLIDVWHDIAKADDLLGEAVQDVAVPEHLQQQILTAIYSHKSNKNAK